jgi:mono/diheme cytochrome c family protein
MKNSITLSKNQKMSRIVFVFILFLFFISCTGKKDPAQSTTPVKERSTGTKEEPGRIPLAVLERGEEVYRKHCMACHLKDASGNPKMFPPLISNKTVNGNPSKLIGIVLNGLAGEIEVNGEIYNQVMIPHNFLSDREIADLLTYVRVNFENSGGRISEEEVRTVRAMN